MQITLPSGATVELRDPDTLKVKDRDKVIAVMDSNKGDAAKAIDMQNALIGLIIESWSFDLVPPSVKVDSLGELSPKDYQVLLNHAKTAQEVLFPSFAESDNPDSPFVS